MLHLFSRDSPTFLRRFISLVFIRRITPVEAERLGGFPDNWTDTGMPESWHYFCMGNSLVVGLVQRIGKNLLKEIKP